MSNENKHLYRVSRKMYLDGLKDEEKVMRITEEAFKCKTEKATRTEDIKDHIDFWVIHSNNKKYGIDVKGVRKNNRSDTNKDDTINWIELQNVNGNKGWIYGKSAYIAFMTNSSVLYVPTKKLAAYAEDNIKGKEIVYENPKNCYIPYQRKGRQDIIIKVPTNDLRKIANHEIMI